MLLFIPRSLCALKRIAARTDHVRFGATTGIRFWSANGLYRAEATDGRRAIVVQGPLPDETPNWPGLRDVPDDAFEAIIPPKDLERACKVGDEYLQKTFKVVGLATNGSQVLLGLGDDCVTARAVEGRFPRIDQVVPKERPLCSFRVDAKLLAETLMTISDLLPETDQGVHVFYYGDGIPLGLCTRNYDTGAFIDGLLVPLQIPKQEEPKPDKVSDADAPDADEEQPGGEAQAEEQPGEQPANESNDPPAVDEKPQRKSRRRRTAKA